MKHLPEISLLLSFAVLSEELNFRQTADRLSLDQSALTRRIQKLEQQLGIKLVERTTKSVALTPAGQTFFRQIQPIIADYHEAIHAAQMVSNGSIGSIRIAYMAFAAYKIMPEAIAKYKAISPDVEVILRFLPTEQQKTAFAARQIDIGFMYNSYRHSDYYSQTVLEERLCLVAPREHPLMQQDSISVADLDGQPLILGSVDMWRDFRENLKTLFKLSQIEMTVALEVSNTLALVGFVTAGFGVTIYPESLTSILSNESIRAKPIKDQNFTSKTDVVWRRGHNNPTVERFVEIVL